jgi:hypothetical protein
VVFAAVAMLVLALGTAVLLVVTGRFAEGGDVKKGPGTKKGAEKADPAERRLDEAR